MFPQDSHTHVALYPAREGGPKRELRISLLPYSEHLNARLQGSRLGDCLLVENSQKEQTLLVSLGSREKPDAETLRQAGGFASRWLLQHEIGSAAVSADEFYQFGPDNGLDAFCEGLILGGYRFGRYKTSDEKNKKTSIHLLCSGDVSSLESRLKRCTVLASGVSLARALSEEPPNVINPLSLAERAAALSKNHGLGMRLLGDEELAGIGAGGLIAVGLGSQTPSQLIVLEYPGRGKGAGSPPVVLVGKALTFDSGGYMLKEHARITEMKYDKAGGAAVLGVLHAAAGLELETPIVGLIPAAENMVSADPMRPGDIIHMLSGRSVEITNTDAEGRLVLADALTYAGMYYQPRLIIDIATLTYGVITALGVQRAGLLSNDDALAAALLACGECKAEHLWRLPLDEAYLDLLHSHVADLKNYSGTTQASPITAGLFLQQFVPAGVPWAHLDILGTAFTGRDLPYCPKGATGFGVRLLVDFLAGLS